jgi:opacity protein-like surface antigen
VKFVVWAALLATAGVAAGQARVIARRSSEITPFAQMTFLNPDWALSPNFGASGGVDFTPFIPLLVQPSLEVRATAANGFEVEERSFSVGLKLAVRLGRVHPYGIVEEGIGGIYFHHPTTDIEGHLYTKDASRIYVVGGGVETNVLRLWQVRMEYTQQYWDLRPPKIYPMTGSVGVTYRIPFPKGKMKR